MLRTDALHAIGGVLLVAASVAVAQPRADWPMGSAGSERAAVTILVFSDFESFPCSRSAMVLLRLIGGYKDVRLIFKHAPAASNSLAVNAHEAVGRWSTR